ncbi:4'-phosphopantetheinyl transferase superfamily protein [Lysinibacillus capsici]|uniref:4'-phosphopantetheinyl transferase family protein n=1 Tax=Lysinibacillus capsici TaxID=2115968 RepID=UPI002E22D55D|nr:4'-phosphopantetheinyl transferase superfamily protein [Lysinibacillus capsici]
MDVICVHITGNDRRALITRYLPYLEFISKEKRKRLSRFVRKDDFIRSLASDILVRVLIVNRLNLSNKKIRFTLNDFGKPYLDGGRIEFNVSHSGEWVVAAVSQFPVGIDVEQIQPVKLDIARRFFSEQEYSDLLAKEGEEQNHYFFDLWTLKESYVKACGQGLSIPLNSFQFSFKDGELLFKNNHSSKQVFFRQYQLNLYKLAVCSPYQDFPEKIEVLKLSELLREACRLL